MDPNETRPATRGEQGAGVFSPDDARENTSPALRVQGNLVVIRELTKNKSDVLRIALDQFHGHDLVDIRICTPLTESSGMHVPTKKGVSIRVELIDDLVEALQDARTEAARRGLL